MSKKQKEPVMSDLVGNFTLMNSEVKNGSEGNQKLSYTLNWDADVLKTFLDCYHTLKVQEDSYLSLREAIMRAVELLKTDVQKKHGNLLEHPKLPTKLKRLIKN